MFPTFRRDKRGAVAIMFALTTVVVVSLVGGAVDFGRAFAVRAKMQNAADAAALAAASSYLLDTTHNVEAAKQRGLDFFNAAMNGYPGAAGLTDLDPASQTVTLNATVNVPTPFLSIMGIQQVTMSAHATATATEGVAGGGSNNEVELALMLDVTGSMGWDSGNGTSKIDALKSASKGLIDVLLPDGVTPKAKISLAPFAPVVKLDDSVLETVTGEPLTKTETQTTTWQCNPQTTCQQVCTRYRSNGNCRNWEEQCTTTYETCSSSTTSTGYLGRCIVDREGSAATTDEAPGVGAYAYPYVKSSWRAFSGNSKYADTLERANTCTPSSIVKGLSSDKAALKAHIDGMAASGGTAGALGTAWAYYSLSPNWQQVFSGTEKPRPYNTEKLKKIAVLMTDGTYNTRGGVGDDDETVSQQAVDTCTSMKANGIEVYTVGFKLDTDLARDTLANCATSPDHVFSAENAAQLETVFKEIAYRAVPLHISK